MKDSLQCGINQHSQGYSRDSGGAGSYLTFNAELAMWLILLDDIEIIEETA